uniref:Uncharacterized protein n=1 Tax=Anguilla anguilla TaxID=7936 RepID=A0A0E9RZU9_ANGAN
MSPHWVLWVLWVISRSNLRLRVPIKILLPPS